jgi:hypothetical protein
VNAFSPATRLQLAWEKEREKDKKLCEFFQVYFCMGLISNIIFEVVTNFT